MQPIFVIFLFQFYTFPAASAYRAGYIIGGEDAEITDWPFMVSMQMESIGHFCGGALYDATHVVTAGTLCWRWPVSRPSPDEVTGVSHQWRLS